MAAAEYNCSVYWGQGSFHDRLLRFKDLSFPKCIYKYSKE